MDCAAGDCDGDVEEEQRKGAVALVYFVLLRRGRGGELCAALSSAVGGLVFRAIRLGRAAFDGGAVLDWNGYYAEHAEGGGRAASGAGHHALDRCGEFIAVGDLCGVDFVVGIGYPGECCSSLLDVAGCVDSVEKGLGKSGCR